MTELTGKTDATAEPGFRFWTLRPVAFICALLAAPAIMVLVGVVTLPIAVGFIILFSAPFGAPSYFGVFAPLAWLAVVKGWRSVTAFILVGLLANIIAGAVMGLWIAIFDDLEEAIDAVTFIHGFGMIFAPLYAAVCCGVFSLLHRPDDGAAPTAAIHPAG